LERVLAEPGTPQDMVVFEISALIFLWQIFSPGKVIFAGVGVLLSVCIIL
jgi:hypothetical protein